MPDQFNAVIPKNCRVRINERETANHVRGVNTDTSDRMSIKRINK